MFKKAEYELSEVGSGISIDEKKCSERNRSLKNLVNTHYYLLFVFTLFFSIIGITIFVGCSNLKINFGSGMKEFEDGIQSVEGFINHIPSNFSFWINERTNTIDTITNDIVTYAVRKPTNFINTTINELVDRLNIIGGGSISGVDIQLNIDAVDIPQIYFENWTIDIPTSEFINVLKVIVDIPYYFGVMCLILSILMIVICFGKGVSLVFDARSRFHFIFKISFWIGLIFGLLFIILTICILYVHILYVHNVGNKIEEIQGYIEGNITVYNHFMDDNGVLVSHFISDNLNVLVNTTNELVEQLRVLIEDNLNRILATNIQIIFDQLDLVNILVRLDDFKVDPKMIDLLWINEKINSIFIGLILFSSVTALFFVLLVIMTCCESKR